MKASAFVAGPRNGAGAALHDLAHAVGFASVERYAGLIPAERQLQQTPLVFFLCAEVEDLASLKPIAVTVRFSGKPSLRFSPLIYFAQSLSVETIRRCIQMGFDDVIALPYTSGDVGERIFRQVGRTHTYYETSTYFGPDRRSRIDAPRPSGSQGGGEFRRIEIVRNPETGINVLRDDFQVVI